MVQLGSRYHPAVPHAGYAAAGAFRFRQRGEDKERPRHQAKNGIDRIAGRQGPLFFLQGRKLWPEPYEYSWDNEQNPS